MFEFEINGHEYRASKLSAFQQLHVSRKLAPIIPKLLPALVAIAGKETTEAVAEDVAKHVANEELASMSGALAPAAEALASMSEEDAEYIYSACLSVVSMKQDGQWRSIWSVQNKTTMFDHIDLGVMTQIVFKVIGDSLGNFIGELFVKAQKNSPTAQ